MHFLGIMNVNFAKKQMQLISYKGYLECTLIQWRLSIYISLSAQVTHVS